MPSTITMLKFCKNRSASLAMRSLFVIAQGSGHVIHLDTNISGALGHRLGRHISFVYRSSMAHVKNSIADLVVEYLVKLDAEGW